MRKGDKLFIREDKPGVGCFKTTVFDLQPGKFFVNDIDITEMGHQYSPEIQKLVDKQNRKMYG